MDPDRWWHQIHHIDEFGDTYPPDEAIARVASRLGGVIDRAQLRSLGLKRGAIDRRIATGRLRRIYEGVYAVGHDALQTRGMLVAGLLVAGPGAALSHRTAAALRRILPSLPPFVEITTTKTHARDRPGLVFHRATSVQAARLHGLPVTTPIRTLRDLAATRPDAELERACSEALVLGLVGADELGQQRGRGGARLARLTSDGIAPTRSQLERRFLRAVARADLPRPATNRVAGGREVDFHWPDHRLVVEVDGWRFHGHRLAFERDRAKTVALQLRGWRVLRFTWRQVCDDPAAVMAAVARFLDPRASRRAA